MKFRKIFSFPFIFLATDLTVRILGATTARHVIFWSMFPALLLSYVLSLGFQQGSLPVFADFSILNIFIARIALASFMAYLLGQLLAANSSQLPLEDQAMQLLLKEQTQTAQTTAQEWTQDLLKKIQSGQNEDEVLALLQDAYPNDEEPALQEKLTRLIFACEMLGRLSVEAEGES